MEKHFKEQCGIDDDKVIRAGYPRCVVADDICSYDHDIRTKKGLAQIKYKITEVFLTVDIIKIADKSFHTARQ